MQGQNSKQAAAASANPQSVQNQGQNANGGDEQVRKYFALLRQAQNEALIQLIAEGLQKERASDPLRVTHSILDFLTRDIFARGGNSENDLQRTNVSAALISILADDSQQIQHQDERADFQTNSFDIAEALVEARLNTANTTEQKQIERLERSLLALPLDLPLHQQRVYQQSLSSGASRCQPINLQMEQLRQGQPISLRDLIQHYEPLLGSSSANQEQNDVDSKGNKQKSQNPMDNKAGLKNFLMAGAFSNARSIKLSDFIDQKFLDEIENEGPGQSDKKLQNQKFPLSYAVEKLGQHCSGLFDYLHQKRQRTSEIGQQNGTEEMTHIIMSPHLALLVHQMDQLLSPEWQRRQIAAVQIKHILLNQFKSPNSGESKALTFSQVVKITKANSQSSFFTLKKDFRISLSTLCATVVPRLVICLLKDNFSDFEGLKVMVPVREECYKLLSLIYAILQDQKAPSQLTNNDIDQSEPPLNQLILALPMIFVAVENEDWNSKLNFFLILKGLVVQNKELEVMKLKSSVQEIESRSVQAKSMILKMFGSLLINALTCMEDEPKVCITEILQIVLPTYMGSFKNAKVPTQTMTLLLDNLTINLQKSDEIEASAIAVFNLVCKVFDLISNTEKYKHMQNFKYRLNLEVFGPFNFHKIIAVRLSFWQLICRAIKSGSFTHTTDEVQNAQDLKLIATLAIQALTIETKSEIVQTLIEAIRLCFQNLKVDQKIEFLQNDIGSDQKLPLWLLQVSPDFGTFKFLELPHFESIEGDYFKVAELRPANDLEWDNFYHMKLKNLTKAIGVIMAADSNTNQNKDEPTEGKNIAQVTMELVSKYVVSIPLQLPGEVQDQQQFDEAMGNPEHHRVILNQALLGKLLSVRHFMLEESLNITTTTQNNHDNQAYQSALDPSDIFDLAYKFLHVKPEDVNINDCWALDKLVAQSQNLQDCLMSYGVPQHVVEPVQMFNEDLARSIQDQCFYIGELEQGLATLQDQIGGLQGMLNQQASFQINMLFQDISQQFQLVLHFVREYWLRIQMIASSIQILLNKAQIDQTMGTTGEDANQNFENSLNEQRDYLNANLNAIIKPVLLVLNQERIDWMVEMAGETLTSLVEVLSKLNLKKALKKLFEVVKDMLVTKNQDCGNFIKLLTNQTDFYQKYNGFWGKTILQPEFTKVSIDEDDQSNQNHQMMMLTEWVSLSSLVLQSYKNDPRADSFLLNAVVKVFEFNTILPESSETRKAVPKLVRVIFEQIQPEHKEKLMLELVNAMNTANTLAFECLEHLLVNQLDSQLKVSKKPSQADHEDQQQSFLVYLPLFILPVVQSLTRQAEIYGNRTGTNRKSVMQILAKLIQLLPLHVESLRANFTPVLKDKIEKGLDFLKVFAENQITEEYDIIIPGFAEKVNLRQYQREGINWMAKLGQFNLNCALCDDMGLGKTLQSLTVVLNESIKNYGLNCTNLVVCPTSLVYNWQAEISKFFGHLPNLRVGLIEGGPSQSLHILSNLSHYQIVILNYERLKSCMDYFQQHQFHYIILDEAHKIKNSKSQITLAANKLKCEHKLALSGTPLQNRVSELWSLFNFLIPDFLEDEQTFNKTYNKYLTGNIKRMQEKLEETQSFVEALKSLKKRIAPFVLRRTKQEVLKELPPKEIQDYCCVMPGVQQKAHTDVEKNYPFASTGGSGAKSGANALRNLIVHRKVCNHPCMVNQNQSSSYEHSGKLLGLMEIFQATEICSGGDGDQTRSTDKNNDGELLEGAGGIMPHRALLFCQMGQFMDIVQKEILERFKIKFLVLKGSMTGMQRQETVNKFNQDPSVKVLLLSTAVGGLGLTLTGANIVIFLEHDWNPMKDLQAMDRAHRIGQTRTVNVYRLILKDTLEEKIMSLQRFKENLAKSVVQNQSELMSNKEGGAEALDLNNVLKSFEEHTVYRSQTGEQQKSSTKKNNAKGGQEKQLTIGQIIAQSNHDQEIAQMEETWKDVDFEKL